MHSYPEIKDKPCQELGTIGSVTMKHKTSNQNPFLQGGWPEFGLYHYILWVFQESVPDILLHLHLINLSRISILTSSPCYLLIFYMYRWYFSESLAGFHMLGQWPGFTKQWTCCVNPSSMNLISIHTWFCPKTRCMSHLLLPRPPIFTNVVQILFTNRKLDTFALKTCIRFWGPKWTTNALQDVRLFTSFVQAAVFLDFDRTNIGKRKIPRVWYISSPPKANTPYQIHPLGNYNSRGNSRE